MLCSHADTFQFKIGSLLHRLSLLNDKMQLARGRRELSREPQLPELESPQHKPLLPQAQHRLYTVTVTPNSLKFLVAVAERKEKRTFLPRIWQWIRILRQTIPVTSMTTNLMNLLPRSGAGLSASSHWPHISTLFLLHTPKEQRRQLRHEAHSFSQSRLLITNFFNPLQIVLLTKTTFHLPVLSTKPSCNGSSIHLPTTRKSCYPVNQGIKPWLSSSSLRLRREGTPQSQSSCLPCWRPLRMWVNSNY